MFACVLMSRVADDRGQGLTAQFNSATVLERGVSEKTLTWQC